MDNILQDYIICAAIFDENIYNFFITREIVICNTKLIELLIELLEKDNLLIDTIIYHKPKKFMTFIYNLVHNNNDYINNNFILLVDTINELYNIVVKNNNLNN